MNILALQFNLFRAAVIIMEAAGALIGVYRLIDDLRKE